MSACRARILELLQQRMGTGLMPTAQLHELLTNVLMSTSSTESARVVAILDPTSRGQVAVTELIDW
eukprot:6470160-Amphidinium_carterae.1